MISVGNFSYLQQRLIMQINTTRKQQAARREHNRMHHTPTHLLAPRIDLLSSTQTYTKVP